MNQDNSTISKTCDTALRATSVDDEVQTVSPPTTGCSTGKAIGRPACYGAASVFSHESKVCCACRVFDVCDDECELTLDAIKEFVDISPLRIRREAGSKALGRSAKTAQTSQAKLIIKPIAQSDEYIASMIFIGDEMDIRPLDTQKHSALDVPLAMVSLQELDDKPDCHCGANRFAQDSKFCRACHSFNKCIQECIKTLDTLPASDAESNPLRRHNAARKKSQEIIKEQDRIAHLEYEIEQAKMDEFLRINAPDFGKVHPKGELKVTDPKVIDTGDTNSADSDKETDEQTKFVEAIETVAAFMPSSLPVVDPLSQLKSLVESLQVHKNYALIRGDFIRLSSLLNTQCLLAPAFRPQPKVGKARGSSVYMDIHRDQSSIDCHWLHCRREVVVTRDSELQPLFDLDMAFPFELAKKFGEQKWTKGHRIRQLLVLTPRQQCQLATLRSEDVDGRLQAALVGLGKGSSRIPPKITAVRLKLYEWAECNKGVRKLLKDYENLWLARNLLGNTAPIQQVSELFALISGKPQLDYKTVKGKLETLDKHVGGVI